MQPTPDWLELPPLPVTVVRQTPHPGGTPGLWTMPDLNHSTPDKTSYWQCYTLELGWFNNQTGKSCILTDSYFAKLCPSEKLGSPGHEIVTREDGTTFDMNHMIYRLEDKHGRKDCLIHNGNFAGDTSIDANHDGVSDFITQIHGCTEVGSHYGEVQRKDGQMQWGIQASVATLEDLIRRAKGRNLVITYSWAEGCEPEDLTDAQAA